MMSSIISLSIVAFLFGFFVDFADLLDEHGLKWFERATLLSGILWGIFGAVLAYLNPESAVFAASIVLYWVLKQKLDFVNHSIGGSLVLLASCMFLPDNPIFRNALVVGFVLQALQGYVGTYIKNIYTLNKITSELIRLRHFIPPIGISLVLNSYIPLIVFIAFTAGLKLSEIWFVRFEKTGKSYIASKLGLSIHHHTHSL